MELGLHGKKIKIISIAFSLSFLLLLCYFSFFDMYHRYFFTKGYAVFAYNLARVWFVVCFMWLLYVVGDFVQEMWREKTSSPSFSLDAILLSFFTGVAICTIVLFILGLLSLYSHLFMVTLSTIIFMLSIPKLTSSLDYFRRQTPYWPGLALFLSALAAFIVTKGLYPGGGHDYFNHYSHFYREVLNTGSILPNQVWYQFFYSKGMGLYFFSMYLTDPLAPQLAASALMIGGAGVIYSILHRTSKNALFPWVGATLYLALFIYTPGPLDNMHQGGWGDLEKPHEPAAILMLTLIWCLIGLFKFDKVKSWGLMLVLLSLAIIIISPATIFIVEGQLIISTFFFMAYKRLKAIRWSITAIFFTGLWFLMNTCINYLLTGIPEDKALQLLLPMMNLDKIQKWGILFELLYGHYDRSLSYLNGHQPLNLNFLIQLLQYFRLDILAPFFILAMVPTGVACVHKKSREFFLARLDRDAFITLICFVIVTVLFTLVASRDQPISYYRLSTFTYGPMLCLSMILLSPFLQKRLLSILAYIMFVFSFCMLSPYVNWDWHNAVTILKNGVRFSIGRYSIGDGYTHQEGLPGRMPWGGIYPPIVIACQHLPKGENIWGLHTHSYSMLPDCQVEEFMSYRFSPHAETIYYGSPLQAKECLIRDKRNYFFISSVLSLTDPLPVSPLFSPQHIAKYLGIVWTDGENTLLTWKEQAGFVIDDQWLTQYKAQIQASSLITDFPYEKIRAAFHVVNHKHVLRNSDLQWFSAK